MTEQLQLSLGSNNLFNIRPDLNAKQFGGAAPASTGGTTCVGGGVTLAAGGSCVLGPNTAAGIVQTAGNGQVFQSLQGTAFDPNGGYYYARISFNF
jgi:hypothetical protein